MSKPSVFKRYVHHDAVHDVNIHCCWGDSASFLKWIRSEYDDAFALPQSYGGLFFRISDEQNCVIFLPEKTCKQRAPIKYAILTHEVVHAATAILCEKVGGRLTRDSDEFFAHYIQHLVTVFSTAMRW